MTVQVHLTLNALKCITTGEWHNDSGYITACGVSWKSLSSGEFLGNDKVMDRETKKPIRPHFLVTCKECIKIMKEHGL